MNNQLIGYKENIFSKIKKFFINIFYKKEKSEVMKENIIEKENVVHTESKKDILEIYNKSKKGEIDIFSIPTDTLEKMCILLEEEIKLKEKVLQEKREKLKAC